MLAFGKSIYYTVNFILSYRLIDSLAHYRTSMRECLSRFDFSNLIRILTWDRRVFDVVVNNVFRFYLPDSISSHCPLSVYSFFFHTIHASTVRLLPRLSITHIKLSCFCGLTLGVHIRCSLASHLQHFSTHNLVSHRGIHFIWRHCFCRLWCVFSFTFSNFRMWQENCN